MNCVDLPPNNRALKEGEPDQWRPRTSLTRIIIDAGKELATAAEAAKSKLV
jgi:hypothetical protein